MTGAPRPRCLALSGGVGGAKLALGLAHAMPPDDLTVIANTGDDFEHLGLTICPDIDTLTYTLAGLNNRETGWGRADETWNFIETLETLGGETWFRLGDRDLALHVERTRRLNTGESLSDITADICSRLGVAPHVAPMSDDPVRTIVQTPDGPLTFQHYFVREQCRPTVTGFRFDGAEFAHMGPAIAEATANPDLTSVVVCPSNPFISIDPILAVPGARAALSAVAAPVIAVSPIVGGRALKGPTAKMLTELGLPCDAVGVARHYGGLLDGFVLDRTDADAADTLRGEGVDVLVTNTLMNSLDDRIMLAKDVLGFAQRIAGDLP
ncbi:MAG: 2-phospho-L-lactate transferase [Alphaproteobacteria bacterium]|nr:2-phospho-L-lactate transferase [Alphaproteobacteria bacterium]